MRSRWWICGLLFWVTAANYVDRSLLGNLAPDLQRQAGWSRADFWHMHTAFIAGYAIGMLLAGRMMDVLGLRLGFMLTVVIWGFAAMSRSFIVNPGGFLLLQGLLGLGEGGNFPAALKTIAEWFPRGERSLATGIVNAATIMGSLIVPVGLPAVLPILARMHVFGHPLGWRQTFLFGGLVDLVWLGAWASLYRPGPFRSREASPASATNAENLPAIPPTSWSKLIRYRQTWAYAAAMFVTYACSTAFLAGVPYFLADRFHLDVQARGVPMLCITLMAWTGSVSGGAIFGWLLKLGWTTNTTRKVALVFCALAPLPSILLPMAHAVWLAVTLIALAQAGSYAFSTNVFGIVSDLFPSRIVASVTGIGGMIGALGGILGAVLIAKFIGGGEASHYAWIYRLSAPGWLVAVVFIHFLAPSLEPISVA